MKSESKPVIFYLPVELIGQIETASDALGISRSAVVRNSLSRDLEFVLEYAIAEVNDGRDQHRKNYLSWRERKAT
jgi:hypothetical protein